MNDEFREFWRTNFPNCPPVSYLFKLHLNELWLRIHSLPDSKRYAENEEETQEMLRRQKKIFDEVIGESDGFLVCLGYDENPVKIYAKEFPYLASLLTQESKPIALKSVKADRKPNEFFQAGFGKQKMRFDDLSEIFIAVANWRITHFFILNIQSKRLFAPYGGGVDLILESSVKRDELKEKYKNWLSSHAKGF